MANNYDDLPDLYESDEDEEECNCSSDEYDDDEFSNYTYEDSDDDERAYPYMMQLLEHFLMNRTPMFMPVPPKKSKTKCKFYMMGNCAKGEFCRFSHDFEPDMPPLIPLKQHSQNTNTQRNNSEQKLSTPCAYYLKGNCLRGSACKFSHTVNMTWTKPQTQAQSTQNQSQSTQSNQNSESVSCSICLEVITETKKFGLLNNCNHAFCLDCIRGWRKTNTDSTSSNIRSCPLCRTQSDFVVPSPVFPASTEEKDVIIKAYKNSLKNIPCKYFEKYKKCPFGRNCFYLHNGVPQSDDPSRERKRNNSHNNSRTNNLRTSSSSTTSSNSRRPNESSVPRNTTNATQSRPSNAQRRPTAPAAPRPPYPFLQRGPLSFEIRPPSESDSDEEDEEDEDEFFGQDSDSDEMPDLIPGPFPARSFQPVQPPLSALRGTTTNTTQARNAINTRTNNTANSTPNTRSSNRTKEDEMPPLIDGPLPMRRIQILRAPTPIRTSAPARNNTTNNTNNTTNNNRRAATRIQIKKQDEDDEMPELISSPPTVRKIETLRSTAPVTRNTSNNTNKTNNIRVNGKTKKEDEDIPPLVPLQRKTSATTSSRYNTRSKKKENEDMPPLVPLQKKKNNNNDIVYIDSDSDEEDEDIPPLVPMQKRADSDDEYEEDEDEEDSQESSEEESVRPQRTIKKYYAKKLEPTTRRTRSQVQLPLSNTSTERKEKLPQKKKTRK